jgi:two-component system, sensor histidine kinase and response regulator
LVISEREGFRQRIATLLASRSGTHFQLESWSKAQAQRARLIQAGASAWIWDLEDGEAPQPLTSLAEVGPLLVIDEARGRLEALRDLGLLQAIESHELTAAFLEHALLAVCQSTSFWSQLIDAVPDPIFVKDERHTWLLHNAASADFIGRAKEELIGKSDFDFFSKEQAAVFWEKDALVFADGKSNTNEERFTDSAGREHFISTKKSIFEDVNGRRLLVGVIRDITDHKELARQLTDAKEKALHAASTKSAFLATMGHELRTPMTGVIGMTEILFDSTLTDDQRELVRIIRRSGAHLVSIIDSILDFSKLEAGKLRLERVAFNLRDSVEQVLDLLAPNAHQKGLELVCDLHRALPRLVRGDPARFSEVVLNLVSNAIKFTDRGHVLVRLSVVKGEGPKSYVRLAVIDSGIGIAESEQEHIFEAYAHRPNPHGGTGLGLTISRQLMELMGGQIEVESTVGVGSTFSGTIPFETVSTEEASTLSITGDLLGQRILLAIDAEVPREVMRRQLESRAIEPATTPTDQILEELRRAHADRRPHTLLILDEPPGTDIGRPILERIRFEAAFAELPILVLTTLERAMSADSFRDSRTAFLAKPALDSRLFEALRALLLE